MLLKINFAVIFSGPEDHTVAPGDHAYFHCHARGNSVSWHINGSIISQSSYMQMGFQFIDRSSPNGDKNKTIVVPATQLFNNTLIECVVREFDVTLIEDGTLFIAGE